MQDRELLELAARASIAEGFRRGQYKSADEAAADLCKDGRVFNPLQDDGDALRLAVKLNLIGALSDEHAIGSAGMHSEDPYAATRRAIVQAAAEIGKNS